jgi:hypothetical protein
MLKSWCYCGHVIEVASFLFFETHQIEGRAGKEEYELKAGASWPDERLCTRISRSGWSGLCLIVTIALASRLLKEVRRLICT